MGMSVYGQLCYGVIIAEPEEEQKYLPITEETEQKGIYEEYDYLTQKEAEVLTIVTNGSYDYPTKILGIEIASAEWAPEELDVTALLVNDEQALVLEKTLKRLNIDEEPKYYLGMLYSH